MFVLLCLLWVFVESANVKHGKVNTEADYCLMIQHMVEINPEKYMKNAFEADLKAIAEVIGFASRRAQNAYNNYKAPGEVMTMSQQAKSKRDAAILEQHASGMSARKIAEMFGMTNVTVSGVINGVLKNPDSGKLNTPSESTSIPLASTERGTDTLVAGGIDLSDYAQLLDSSDNEDSSDMPFSLDDDWSNMESDVPFNLEADAGFTAEQPTNTVSKPSEYDKVQEAKVNPTQLQEKYVELMASIVSKRISAQMSLRSQLLNTQLFLLRPSKKYA